MEVFVQLLGLLLLTLTFTGSFRLARYLARSNDATLQPLLIASTLTSVFVISVDVILLATGLLTLGLPLLWILHKVTGWTPSIDVSRSTDTEQHTDPEPVPEQDPIPEPGPRPETGPRNEDRPLLDLVGRLADHLTDQRRNDDDMEPIDIRDPADDTNRYHDYEHDDDYDW